jgi:hypothetical protein
MNKVKIKGFTPYPGNVSTYHFSRECNHLLEGDLLLVFDEEPNLGLKISVLKKILIEDEVRVQFRIHEVVKSKDGINFKENSSLSNDRTLEDHDIEEIKELLLNLDEADFGHSDNCYMAELNEEVGLRRLCEILGGCLNRPYKFPFDDSLPTESFIKVMKSRFKIYNENSYEMKYSMLKQELVSDISLKESFQ